MRPITISIDDDTYEGSKDLSRRMSISKLVRHMIKANSYTDEQWAVYRLTDEGKAGIAFFKPLRDRLNGKK